MTRVPDSVVEERAKEWIGMLNDPKYMCTANSVPDAMKTIAEITEWSEDFETFTHDKFHLYPGWNQDNFVLFVSLIPTPEQLEKQNEIVAFCLGCGSRCAVDTEALEDVAMQRGFRMAMEDLSAVIPTLIPAQASIYEIAVKDLESKGRKRFGVDWNKK